MLLKCWVLVWGHLRPHHMVVIPICNHYVLVWQMHMSNDYV